MENCLVILKQLCIYPSITIYSNVHNKCGFHTTISILCGGSLTMANTLLLFWTLTLCGSFVTFYSLQYLPKEIGKYRKINWLSWQAWLWPRKLSLTNNDVILEESTPSARGVVRRPQLQRRATTASMTTSVFVTPGTSPPRESVYVLWYRGPYG